MWVGFAYIEQNLYSQRMKPGLKAEARPANDHRESVELSKRFPECGRCCAALLVMRPWSWWPSPQLGQFLPRSGVEWSRVSVIKYTVTWEQWPVWTKGVIEVFGDSTYTHNKARILKFARQWKSFQTSIPISSGEWLHTPPWPWLWLWNILILKIIRIGWSRFAKYPNIIVWNVVDTFSMDTDVCRAAASHCSEMRCATSRCLLFIAFLTVLVI